MEATKIVIRGAREHNLKNISLELPRNQLIVFTGISGSGKSSLAFDTIYAEGQRKYVESLSSYARQFLGQMEKPDVDSIEGLSPAISIDQKGVMHNPRSTVGTITEVHDYLRLLYARTGKAHCPSCGKPIEKQTSSQIIEMIEMLPAGSRFMILAPVVRSRKGEYNQLLEDTRKKGFVRARIDGALYELDDTPDLDKKVRHDVEIVVDRLVMKEGLERRLADSVETALGLGEGIVIVEVEGEGDRLYSEHFACADCGVNLAELEPRMFSFNNPYGACPTCSGLGFRLEIDPELVVPDPSLSLDEGAVAPWSGSADYFYQLLKALAEKYEFSTDIPYSKLPAKAKERILYGTDEQVYVRYRNRYGRLRSYFSRFEGVVNNLQRRYEETDSDYARAKISQYMSVRACPACEGARLKPETLAVTVGGKNIYEVSQLSITRADEFMAGLKLSERDSMIAERIVKEIRARLKFLIDVGLNYLTLERMAATLAGGEAQRIRLATQIGSGLAGVLYVLDEPTTGLHFEDIRVLLGVLNKLVDKGNTVIVIEHNLDIIKCADYIIDLGPEGGEKGGSILVSGTPEDIVKNKESYTAKYLQEELISGGEGTLKKH